MENFQRNNFKMELDMYSLVPFMGVWTDPVVLVLSLLCSWWCGDIFSTFNIDDAKFILLFAFAGKGLHDGLSRSLSNSCKWMRKKNVDTFYIDFLFINFNYG